MHRMMIITHAQSLLMHRMRSRLARPGILQGVFVCIALLSGWQALSLGVNCRSLGVWLAGAATAGEPKDKKMIFERIRANGGFLALNVLLKNQLMQVTTITS